MRRKAALWIGIAVCVVVCCAAAPLAYRQLAWQECEQMPEVLEQKVSAYEADAPDTLVASGPSYVSGDVSCMPVLRTFFMDVPRNSDAPWSFTADILTSWDSGDKPLFQPQPVLTGLTLELHWNSDHLTLISSIWRDAGKNTYRCTLDSAQLEQNHGYVAAPVGTLNTAGEEPFSGEATVTATGTIQCGARTFDFTIAEPFEFDANLP